MDDLYDELVALFDEAARAHHQTYIQTDGADPEWPLWYADYLIGKLPKLLHASFTKSELVYLLYALKQRAAARSARRRLEALLRALLR